MRKECRRSRPCINLGLHQARMQALSGQLHTQYSREARSHLCPRTRNFTPNLKHHLRPYPQVAPPPLSLLVLWYKQIESWSLALVKHSRAYSMELCYLPLSRTHLHGQQSKHMGRMQAMCCTMGVAHSRCRTALSQIVQGHIAQP